MRKTLINSALCPLEHARLVRQGGIHSLADVDAMRNLPGPDGAILRGVWADSEADFNEVCRREEQLEQHNRPYAFVRKWVPFRRWSKNTAARASTARGGKPHDWGEPSRCITEAEFSDLYSAADFADYAGLPLDVHVTINWGLLGLTDEADIQAAFTGFQKCRRDWLAQRGVGNHYLVSHENSPYAGLHTHLMVYVSATADPFVEYEYDPANPFHVAELQAVHIETAKLRREFRAWARSWARRNFADARPKAIKVRCSPRQNYILHWLFFHYAVKGFDRGCVVVPERMTDDGLPVMLGDLVAFDWKDPGPVHLRHRVQWSASLGPDRRKIGVPAGMEVLLPPIIAPPNPFEPPGEESQARKRYLLSPPCKPNFRSVYEGGSRDVRRLYPADFVEQVTKVYAGSPAPEAPDDMWEAIEALGI